jgi:ADP-ribosyl-[dinitrogen reductase] hydrolase
MPRFGPISSSVTKLSFSDRARGALWGHLVGDALGVPVEFVGRIERDRDPVHEMRAGGAHRQQAGTWSDDGALMLCTVEALEEGFSPDRMARLFQRWVDERHWTARGEVFDIGNTTRRALCRIAAGTPAEESGGTSVDDNGNGSLMRILPVALRYCCNPPAELFSLAARASRITHAHARSTVACGLLCLFAVELLRGRTATEAYQALCASVPSIPEAGALVSSEKAAFARILGGSLASVPREAIRSGGYVVDTLEAALWSLLQGGSYSDMTLRAVNLGSDTDTTGAVTGGLAGILHGFEAIPSKWISALPRREQVMLLFERFFDSFTIDERILRGMP